ncbi:MAG TPA: sulfatase-like hydrolase/transferase [Vicinamibacterales bacterium]|jgi:arylsulfatase A-like enzyme/Tfp pilus assembly protein PilF
MRRAPALFLFALVAAAAVRAQAPAPDVLLVTIDTVRADHIGAYGYTKAATPTIDRLAREGIRFDDATSQAPLTGPAHAALLTGVYPARLGVRDNATTALPPTATTLAEMFKAKGYRTGGFVGAFILGSEYGFGQGFDVFDATFPQFRTGSKLQAQRVGGDVVADAIKWLGTGNQPFFAWVHLYDAHAPYDPPPPFRARFAASPYDGEIAYVDSCIAQLVASLERTGHLDRTAVVVVADHGEGLGDHGEAEHGLFLYDSVLHVPLVMRLPDRKSAGAVVTRQVRAIDVAPTIASLAGIAMHDVDGENVLPLAGNPTAKDPPPSYAETYYPKWHFGWSELRSVRVGDWKYIDAPKPELYDVRADRTERRNVIDTRSALAGGLSKALNQVAAGFGSAATTEAPTPDPETLARLRSLGYVGIAAPSPGVRGPDPKDMVPKLEMFRTGITDAMNALERNAPDQAITQLKKLVAINDRSYELHLFLGDAYAAKHEYQTALGEYDAAALLNPHTGAPAVSQARVFLAMGETSSAQRKIDDAVRIEPGSSEAAVVRAQILEKQGRGDDALAQYDAAIRTNGSDTQARAGLASLAMRMRRYEAAQPQFEKLLEMGYRPSRMHFGLGQIAEARGDTQKAIAEYKTTLSLEPGFTPARSALSKLGGH